MIVVVNNTISDSCGGIHCLTVVMESDSKPYMLLYIIKCSKQVDTVIYSICEDNHGTFCPFWSNHIL